MAMFWFQRRARPIAPKTAQNERKQMTEGAQWGAAVPLFRAMRAQLATKHHGPGLRPPRHSPGLVWAVFGLFSPLGRRDRGME